MKCQICGGKIDKETKTCTVCGHVQMSGKKTSLLAAIATVLVIVVLAGGLTAGYFLYGKDKIEEYFIKQQLSRYSDKGVVGIYYDDYNGDGRKEAFAVTGLNISGNISSGKIWFVKNRIGIEIQSSFRGTINGVLSENGKKYFSVESENKDKEVASVIFGVDEKNNTYQPETSGRYKKVHQEEDGKPVTGDGTEIVIEPSEK